MSYRLAQLSTCVPTILMFTPRHLYLCAFLSAPGTYTLFPLVYSSRIPLENFSRNVRNRAIAQRLFLKNANMKNAHAPPWQCRSSRIASDAGFADGYETPPRTTYIATVSREDAGRKPPCTTILPAKGYDKYDRMATITLCTRCKRPGQTRDENITALSVPLSVDSFHRVSFIRDCEMDVHFYALHTLTRR